MTEYMTTVGTYMLCSGDYMMNIRRELRGKAQMDGGDG